MPLAMNQKFNTDLPMKYKKKQKKEQRKENLNYA